MQIFEVVQEFPVEERSLLAEELVRSSRSVCANFAKVWQKRRFMAAFVMMLNEVEAEAAETQAWLEFAILCGYVEADVGQEIHGRYTQVLAEAGRLIDNAEAWQKGGGETMK